jgi:hypothetical protein
MADCYIQSIGQPPVPHIQRISAGRAFVGA